MILIYGVVVVGCIVKIVGMCLFSFFMLMFQIEWVMFYLVMVKSKKVFFVDRN